MTEFLEKIPVEKRWKITAKILTGIHTMIGSKIMPQILGMEKGIFSPILGWEKWVEIQKKIYSESGRKFVPWVKDMFNIPVENAIGAEKLMTVAVTLLQGPEFEAKIVEATPERVVMRGTRCAFWERNKELISPELRVCDAGDQEFAEEGLNAINPKFTCKHTKVMPWGDPYCEFIIEFKDE
jgi:hypothetical protein